MRQVVRDVFFDFTAEREGFTPFPYADTLNLVSTGVGNKIDNGRQVLQPANTAAERMARAAENTDESAAAMAPALTLPWKKRAPGWTSKNPVAGALVSSAEVADAWLVVKRMNARSPGFAQQGGFKYAGLTNITLDMQGLRQLFERTLNAFDATLSSRYPTYQEWPADAQLATLSMAWAMGPKFNFPQFKAAVDAGDFEKAAELSFFRGGGGSPNARSGRNKENELMFKNAAMAVKGGANLDLLFFPGVAC
jgi:hypothetical protein